MLARNYRWKSVALVMAAVVAGTSTIYSPGLGGCEQAKSQQSQPSASMVVELLTPPEGDSFQDYLQRFHLKVKRAWFLRMPEAAQLGEKGSVVVELHLRRDGKLEPAPPVVSGSSGRKPLDRAAIKAILDAAPFEHFPEKSTNATIEMRVSFFYNLPPPNTNN